MEKLNVILVGSGAFAQTFKEHLGSIAKDKYNLEVIITDFHEDFLNLKNLHEKQNIILHTGSGRELSLAIKLAQKHSVTLIQAATIFEPLLPEKLNFAYIEAPNLSIPIIKLFAMLKSGGDLFKNYDIAITESHQAKKTTLPGTAKKFAEFLEQDVKNIKSIRDPKTQAEILNIPNEHLNAHAYHLMTINALGAEISIQTKILGRLTYVYGLLEIIKINHSLEKKKYFVSDLIEQKLI